MSDYSRSTNFTAKDALTPGDPNKKCKGSEIDNEYDAVATAVSTKTNKVAPAVASNIATLSAGGDLEDSGVTAAELSIIDGATVTTAELNLLDGVTATTAELNTMDGITASVVELNLMDGVTSTTAEINILDGVTSTATELNLLDGVTSTTAELNILDGVTATTAEMNYLDNVDLAAADLQKLADVTATATELNYTDGVTSAIQTQLDAKAVYPVSTTDLDADEQMTTANVIGQVAGATAGAVGTYTFARYSVGDVAINVTVAGSALNPTSAAWSVNAPGGSNYIFGAGSALTGTWRCMAHYDRNGTDSVVDGATLWLRIS